MRACVTSCFALLGLVASATALLAQPLEEGPRVVLRRPDSSLVGGMLLSIDSVSVTLRGARGDTLKSPLDDLASVTLIARRPLYGGAAVALGLQSACLITALRNRSTPLPLADHGDYLLTMFPGLGLGALLGTMIENAARQQRDELDVAAEREQLTALGQRALDAEPSWSLLQYAGIVYGEVDRDAVYGSEYRETGTPGIASLGNDITLLRRLELGYRIARPFDLAISYALLAQPDFTGEIRFEYESTNGPVIVSAPMAYRFGGEALLLGGHYRLGLGPARRREAVLVRAGAAAGIAAPEVWRDGESFARGVRPAAIGSVEVTIGLGSTRLGVAADYLLVGALELSRAGTRGEPTPFDPSSGCIGLVLGFAL
jgi:hypothetical protein